MCSATKISRLETGARKANPRDVRDLCRLYEVDDQNEADELMALALEARQAGWWTKYDDQPLLTPFLGLEQEAVAITSYSMFHVPALLQSPDYASRIIRGIERKIQSEVLDQRVAARMLRQRLLDQETPPRYRALLDEAVLRRQVGSPAIMYAQLGKILARIHDEKVVVQVVPFDVGVHASIDSNFDLFEFGEDSPQRPVVFVEGLLSNRYQERPVEVARYREALEYLRDAALSPTDSISLITKIRGTYGA